MNDREITLDGLAKLVAWVVGLLGLVIVVLSLCCCFLGWSAVGKMDPAMFELVVTRTLLPLFTSSIAAVLTWIFGKPLVAALATRLTRTS